MGKPKIRINDLNNVFNKDEGNMKIEETETIKR